MKRVLFLLTVLFLCSGTVFTQSCSGNPPITCSGEKIATPSIPQPLNVKLAAATCSTLVVKWTGNATQEYVAKAMYKNTVTNNVDTITSTNIACDANNNCTASIPVIAGTIYTWSVEAKSMIGSCTFYSYPVSGRLEYPIAACNQPGSAISFSGKVILQGAYNISTGKMNNDLNTSGVLQTYATLQPYNTAGFNYPGTENITPGFFVAHPDIVDWVLLELRDPNAPATVIGRRAAFVQQDGTLVETDGVSAAIQFNGVAAGDYFVTIKHRNHLGIRTATPVNFSTGTGSYDFTTANFKSFKSQSYTSTVQMGNVWVMRGGYTNLSNATRYSGPNNDQNQILNNKLGGSIALIQNNVYAREDVNMNGNIKWSGPANDQNFLLNVSLNGSISAVYAEQIINNF
jgi:hypothetical protein